MGMIRKLSDRAEPRPLLPRQVHVALTSADELEQLYRDALSRGELFLPSASAAVGTPLELAIDLEGSVSMTVSARVSSVVPGPRKGVLASFDPMNPFEFDAIFSLLQETAAAQRSDERQACPGLAAGTVVHDTAGTRSTQPVTAEQRRLVRLELELARARVDLEDGQLDAAGAAFERILASSPRCRDAVEGMLEIARRRCDSQVGRLDSLLGR